jgi:hypothetical protein
MRAVGAVIDHVVCSGGAALDDHLVETIAASLDVPCLAASSSNASSSGAALLAHDAVTPGTAVNLGLQPVPCHRPPAGREEWLERREALLVGRRAVVGSHGGQYPQQK